FLKCRTTRQALPNLNTCLVSNRLCFPAQDCLPSLAPRQGHGRHRSQTEDQVKDIGVRPPVLQPSGHSRYPHHQPCARLVMRSEEHTSELQSLTNLVCRLLL